MLTITTSLPHKHLHPNARPHWAAKAKAVKAARWSAYGAALCAMHDLLMPIPHWPRASIRAIFYVKDRRGISADEDGRVASLKAICDGIADAGVVANDRGLTWLSPPVVHLIDKANPRLVLEVSRIEDRPTTPAPPPPSAPR